MYKKLKDVLIGKSLKSSELKGEKLNVFWGLPIMASDAVSSVAYAVEEILLVLIAIGSLAFKFEFVAGICVIALMAILIVSYRQTIDSYPNGGGAYAVAKANLGETCGLVACAALIMGYIMTVAVSNSSATAALIATVPALAPYKVYITIFLIALILLGNLRGVRESAKLFAIPTYVFIFSMIVLVVVGLIKSVILKVPVNSNAVLQDQTGNITILLFLNAFAAGCAGLTGIEAISNAVPNFKTPSQKNAKKILLLLALICAVIFLGVSFLASYFKISPHGGETVLSQLTVKVFGNGILFYIVQISTLIVLAMAANTSFSGLPLLLYSVASDGYVPRQFTIRGTRLSFSYGIMVLGIISCLLVVIFKANVHKLVPLYSVGVFISFTLSQFGMFCKWIRSKDKVYKIIINGIGSLATFCVVLLLLYNNFLLGAWITLALIVVLVVYMKITKAHYNDIAKQLYLAPEELQKETESIYVVKKVIVVVNDLNKSSLKAMNYARQLAEEHNLIAFHVSLDEERSKSLKEKWEYYKIDIPLVIEYTPYRDVIDTLYNYIQSEKSNYGPNDMITVVVPQFVVRKSWHNLYHNQTAFNIRRKLLRDRHIAVISVPYVLAERKKNDKPKRSSS